MPVIWVSVDYGTQPTYTGETVPSIYWNSITQTGSTTPFYNSIITPTNSVTYPNYTIRIPVYVSDDWEHNVSPEQYYELARHRVYICRERTEAEERRLAEEARQREARARVAARERELAKRRAKELLLSHLTKEQRRTFEENEWFIVKGGKSGREYRIHTGSYAGNVEMVEGSRVQRLCCHCDGIPLHDHHVAQLLALKYDENYFLSRANRSWA